MDKEAIRTLVIDDEPAFAENLVAMLRGENLSVQVIGKAQSIDEGLAMITQYDPDLVFLDIMLREGSGFDLLRRCSERNFQVIFITAYDQYAIEAFKFSAIDYLLKPVASHELVAAVERVHSLLHLKQGQADRQLRVLLENMQGVSAQNRRLVLRESETLHVINLTDILWCAADGSYTTFHLEDGSQITVSQHLKEYEMLLESQDFFRVHRSHLVNLQKIRRLDKADGGTLHLTDSSTLPVSVRKREHLVHRLSKLG
ncbi:MAG: LytTR family DNA-binding domain-containing protein [Bacteroidota bacterium]